MPHADPVPGIDWDSFGFSLNDVETDKMWVSRAQASDGIYSTEDALQPMGPIPMSPAATVLNYGQALFEGLKAFRRADGTVALFRPQRNALRMQAGAERFFLPPVSTELFVQAAEEVVRANGRWIPPQGKGALYLRPLLMGTGAGLGVKPSTEATFCIFGSPVGNYFKGDLQAIRLQAVRGYSRAAPGGSGAIKASGNYAPAFSAQKAVRARGYDEILCLDAVSGQVVEEAGASNFFVYSSDTRTLVTPTLETATILPGVTRASILELAEQEFGCTVVQGRITLDDLKSVDEAFCCGTGAVITPVGCVSVYDDGREQDIITFGDGTTGTFTRQLFEMLTSIQSGTASPELAAKYKDWIHIVEP